MNFWRKKLYLIDKTPVFPSSYEEIELECLHFLNSSFPENIEKPRILDVLSLEDYLYGYKLAIDDSLVGTNIEGYTDFLGKAFYVPLKTYDALVRGYNNNRERFTTTHEAGHIILHRKIFENKSVMAARKSKLELPTYMDPEWQANAAAGALLMPLPSFYHEYKKVKSTDYLNFYHMHDLAEKFQVSTDTVSIRIRTLSNKGVQSLIKRIGL
jgi:hypothetical protein